MRTPSLTLVSKFYSIVLPKVSVSPYVYLQETEEGEEEREKKETKEMKEMEKERERERK